MLKGTLRVLPARVMGANYGACPVISAVAASPGGELTSYADLGGTWHEARGRVGPSH